MATTTVYFIRHLHHGEGAYLLPTGTTGPVLKNQLTTDAEAEGVRIGLVLKKNSVAIDAAYSSPRQRCVGTIYAVLKGYGKMVDLTGTDVRLSDLAADREFDDAKVAALKAAAKAAGKEAEEFLLESAQYADIMNRRGREGETAILKVVGDNPGKAVIVCSHGGSRMEATIMALMGKKLGLDEPEFLFERGGIAVLEFEADDLTKVTYLGNLAKTEKQSDGGPCGRGCM